MAGPLRQRIAQIIDPAEHGDRASRWFDRGIIALILVNVLFVILSTVPDLSAATRRFFFTVEGISLAAFSFEYLLRVWVAPEHPQYRSAVAGRLRWMATPLALIDLLAILPFYLFLIFPESETARLLRVFITLRLLKLGRYSESLQTFGRVIRSKSEELLLTGVVLLVLLVFAASAMYVVESDEPATAFTSIPASMWWAIVTLTTVGYGDTYPVTAAGKALAGLIALVGIGLFALPAGLLASGFADEMQKRRVAVQPERGAGAADTCPHCGEALGASVSSTARDAP